MSWKGFDSDWLKAHENKSLPSVPHSKPCERTRELAVDLPRETQSTETPVVRFRLCRVKLLDVDAKWASVKDLLDGLTNAGLIPGDKEGQIRLEVEQLKVRSYALEETCIEIENPCLP